MILNRLFPVKAETSTLSQPMQWLIDAWSGGASSSGERVTPAKAMSVAAYFACIRNISEDVGKLPFSVYERLEDRGRSLAWNHPAYRLIHDEPNPEMSAMTFRETLTAHALGWSGGYAEIVRNNAGQAMELWPLDPTSVCVGRLSTGGLAYRVTGSDGKQVILRGEDVLHIHGLGYDGLTGYMLPFVARESIGGALAVQNRANAFFKNGAVTSGILQVAKQMDKAAMELLRESFTERYVGQGNHYKPLILTQGTTYTPISVDPDKAQQVDTLQWNVEEMCRLFRMPPHKIQNLLRSTNNNIEHQAIEYVQDALDGWLKRWEHECNRKLILPTQRAKYYTKINEKALLRGDTAARSAYYREMFNVGVLSQNDIRELEDMNPVEGGNTYYLNRALIPSKLAKEGLQGPKEESQPPEQQVEQAVANMLAPRDKAIDALGKGLSDMNHGLSSISGRVESLEVTDSKHDTRLDGQLALIDGLQAKTDEIEAKTTENQAEIQKKTTDLITSLTNLRTDTQRADATAAAQMLALNLASAYNRLLKQEATKAEAAIKDGRIKQWADGYYQDRENEVFSAISAPIDAFCGSIWAIWSEKEMPAGVKAAIFERTKAMAEDHVKRSRKQVEEKNVSAWASGQRAIEDAAGDVQRIINRMNECKPI